MRKFILLLVFAAACRASDWASLYDSSKLDTQRQRMQTAISFLIQNEITPFIPQEAATSFGLQAVDVPVSGPSSNPLSFHADGNHIVLPVRTLLFVEDLSLCYAWLWTNRYTTRTIDEYLSMLRYRSAASFADGKYPPPLVAMHIPDNALSEPRVVEAAVRLRRTAHSFLLLHQFGHLQLGHEVKRGRGYSEAQEEQADEYALNVMKNNSATPTGLLLVMQSLLFFEGGESGVMHPVTSHRLEAMAHFLDGRVTEFVRGRPDRATATSGIFNIATLLEEGAQWLAVRGHEESLQQVALRTDTLTLTPRPLPKTTR